jgi:hypothetical protein
MKVTEHCGGLCPLPDKEGWWIGFGTLNNVC